MLLSLGEKQQLFLGRSLKKKIKESLNTYEYILTSEVGTKRSPDFLVSVSLSVATDINTADYSITWKYVILPPVLG